MKKFILTTVMAAQIAFCLGAPAQAEPGESKLFIDQNEALVAGEIHTLEVPPRVWQGTTMLPLRFVGENILTAQVHWDQATRTITMSKDGTMVQLVLDHPQASVNGRPVTLTVPPFTEKDRTLVPLRFLAETFGYEVHYDAREKSILLRRALPPVAQFELSQAEIIAGQKIWAEDYSYDPYGYPITERRWRINRDPKLTSSSLASFFTTPPAGEYIIGLQVKNKAGAWSEWVEKTLIVRPNEAPRIVEFRPIAPEIDPGENLAFRYRADNEPWEEIVEERWRYRHLDGDIATAGKPRSFFQPGTYEVTLQVKDAYGNWSEPASTHVTVTDRVREKELVYKFKRPLPGEIIDNVALVNYNELAPETNYRSWVGGPTLLLSNSPEAVPAPGILYRDKVSGAFRVMFHHKNSTDMVDKLLVVAENQGPEPVTLILKKTAAAGPNNDVMHLGQLVALNYLAAPEQNKPVVILPGEKLLLYQSPGTGWKTGQSITGMFDLDSDGPLSIAVAALGPDDTLARLEFLPLLPRDVHARGTFTNPDRWVEIYVSPEGPRKIEIGKDQQGFENWLVGYDALTGAPVVHKGNYGAVYYLTFHAVNHTGVLLNPRGLTFKGAFMGFDGNSYKAPATDGFYGSRKAAVVGVIEPGQPSQFVYTPPNGSDAPVILGLIPEEFWPDF
ncbi:MAG TPA: hypothetical protein GXX34_06540 [Clostridia bacterium]|nr:hypothetical protein [Clostridia bacterium]